jgi:hypothetical protein
MRIGIGIGLDFSKKVRRVVIRDSFNRADNSVTPGNADTGQAWVNSAASVAGIQSNRLVFSLSATGNSTIDCGISDCIISIKFVTVFQSQRLLCRWVDANNEIYVDMGTTTASLIKRIVGATTSIGSMPIPVAGDTITVVLLGSNISVYVNGVLKINVTETFNQTATKLGVRIAGTTAFGSTFDNLIVTTV